MNINELVDKFTALRSEIDAHMPAIDADHRVVEATGRLMDAVGRPGAGGIVKASVAASDHLRWRDEAARKIPGLWEKVTELRKLREEITKQLMGPF